jgi:hypothetical protein
MRVERALASVANDNHQAQSTPIARNFSHA